ncbi:MAG: type II toxin-antitoxin system RatA family toxin [Wenzhouxiangellaceae bacterium]|nr:type II toxin-antitoxin system RatA family toxin [Wenzhouxiangellaceae bacterium]
MPEVNRFALVPHSPEQMFDLVRDVERYPEFLSWVVAARVHEQSEHHQLASLEVSVAGITRQVTTRNELKPGEHLTLDLAEGPFRHFSGQWRFTDLGIGCRIELSLGFDFDNPVLVAAFSRGFVKVANRMVDDFCRRADTLYG